MKFASRNHMRDFKKEKAKKLERKILITLSLLYNYSYSLYFNVILIKKLKFRFFSFWSKWRSFQWIFCNWKIFSAITSMFKKWLEIYYIFEIFNLKCYNSKDFLNFRLFKFENFKQDLRIRKISLLLFVISYIKDL